MRNVKTYLIYDVYFNVERIVEMQLPHPFWLLQAPIQ